MKKIAILLTLLITGFFALTFSVNATELDGNLFTDGSKISDDINNLGLDYTDYVKVNDKEYNDTSVIALSEYYHVDGFLYLYIYVYNPYRIDTFTYTELSVNGSKPEAYPLTRIASDADSNIVKYEAFVKFEYSNSEERNYYIYTLKEEKGSTGKVVNFNAKVSQAGDEISFEYDSYVFVTEKDLVTFVVPKEYTYTWYEEFVKWYFNTPYFNLVGAFSDHWKEYNVAQYTALNFNLSEDKITKINEIDVTFNKYFGSTAECKNEATAYASDIQNKELVESYTLTNPYTVKNVNETFNLTQWSSNKDWTTNINTIDTGANMYNNLKISTLVNDGWLKADSAKAFTNYNWSCLIGYDVAFYSDYNGWKFWKDKKFVSKFEYDDLKVIRINYNIDDVTYNAKCSSGESIDSRTLNKPAEKGPNWGLIIFLIVSGLFIIWILWKLIKKVFN